MPREALWLRKTPSQLVAQYTARRAPSAWCEDEEQRRDLIRDLCLGLVFAIALRIPDRKVADELFEVYRKALDLPQ